MNIIDKSLAFFAPKLALSRTFNRKKLELLNSGYSNYGASRVKSAVVGWNFRGGSADEDILDNLDVLRQRCRDMYMGVPVVTGALKTMRTNIIGQGLYPKSQIDYEYLGMTLEQADALKHQIEMEFDLWADSPECDMYRQFNFYNLQQLAILSQDMSGDVFVVLPYLKRGNNPYELKIQLLEADMVTNPLNIGTLDIKSGVEKNSRGEIVAYHVAKKHPLSASMDTFETTRISAYGNKSGRRNVLHLMTASRPGQRRGEPLMAPVIEALKQLGRYTEAELDAAVVSSMFSVCVKTLTPENNFGAVNTGQQSRTDDDGDISLAPGMINYMLPNESIETVNPLRPNAAFSPFVAAIMEQIGAAIEVPSELLRKKFDSSYSASRAALLDAWKMFKMRRQWFVESFCQPVYEEWFTEAVLKERINAPGFFKDPMIKRAYLKCEWHGPSPMSIDPVKEAQAAVLRIQSGLSTVAREAAELNGSDWEDNIKQRGREIELIKKMEGEDERDIYLRTDK